MSGTLEVQSSKRTSKVQYQAQQSIPAKKKPTASTLNAERVKMREAEKKKTEIVQIYNCNLPKDDKVNQLIRQAEHLEGTHSWKTGGNQQAALEWHNELSHENKHNFDKLYEEMGVKYLLRCSISCFLLI